MDFLNIDLDSVYERDADILSSYSFDTLLLEISSNLSEINEETVKAQFELTLKNNVQCAREIFAANLKNIVAFAQKEKYSY